MTRGGHGCSGGTHPQKKGGRPPCTVAQPTLEDNLRHLLQEFTAGDPMRAGVLWTNLSLREWSRRLVALGTPASRRTIRRLLRKLKLTPYGRTKALAQCAPWSRRYTPDTQLWASRAVYSPRNLAAPIATSMMASLTSMSSPQTGSIKIFLRRPAKRFV